MEDKNDSSEFKFSLDDDEIPDRHFHTKRKVKPAEENKKSMVILLPVLLFLLIVAVLFPAYISIKKQIENIHDSGSTEAMKISADLEAKITSLSSRYEELEKSLNEKVFPVITTFSSFEQSIASIKEGLKKAEQNVDKISTSQTDKKELDNLAAQMEKNLAPLRENLRSVESAIKSADEKFTKEAAELNSSFKETKERVNKIQNIISEPSPTGGIDKDTLETALENQQKTYQKRIDLLIENLESKDDKIKSLQTKMEELEKGLKSLAAKTVSSKSPASKAKSVKKEEHDEDEAAVVHPIDQISKSPESKSEPVKKAEHDEDVVHPIDQVKPKPGTFIEQDINEEN